MCDNFFGQFRSIAIRRKLAKKIGPRENHKKERRKERKKERKNNWIVLTKRQLQIAKHFIVDVSLQLPRQTNNNEKDSEQDAL